MTIRQTDDKAWAEEVRAAIKANDGYCPCQIEKTDDTKCICKEFRAQESGKCRCGLYEKEDENSEEGESVFVRVSPEAIAENGIERYVEYITAEDVEAPADDSGIKRFFAWVVREQEGEAND